jgi:hypothetical protein
MVFKRRIDILIDRKDKGLSKNIMSIGQKETKLME